MLFRSHHEPGQWFQFSCQPEADHHPVEVVEVFPDLLDEEDFTPCIGLVGGSGQGVKEGEVPPGERSCGHSRPVERVAWPCEGVFITPEKGHQSKEALIGEAVLAEAVTTHGTVDRAESLPVKKAVQQGNVAVTGHPLGMFPESPEIEVFQQADGAVTAAGAENGIHGRVVEGFLEVGEPFPVGAGILKPAACGMPAQFHLVAFSLQPPHHTLQRLRFALPGRGDDPDHRPLLQKRR